MQRHEGDAERLETKMYLTWYFSGCQIEKVKSLLLKIVSWNQISSEIISDSLHPTNPPEASSFPETHADE